jgi:hypothetical protein
MAPTISSSLCHWGREVNAFLALITLRVYVLGFLI